MMMTDSLTNQYEMRRAEAAHDAMRRALYTFRPQLNTREMLLALQGVVASIIVDGYLKEQRGDMCEEHAQQVRDSVRKMTEANLGRK
jgi:hypothetical protein